MGQQASLVRKDLYAFLLDECGVKIQGDKHTKLKAFMMAHANAQAEDLLAEIANLQAALAKRKDHGNKRPIR